MVLLSRSLLNFLRTFASLIRSSFFKFGKILPHLRGIQPSFFALGRELDKKIAQVARISSLKKIFPRVAWGERTQLELSETLWLFKVKKIPTRLHCGSHVARQKNAHHSIFPYNIIENSPAFLTCSFAFICLNNFKFGTKTCSMVL